MKNLLKAALFIALAGAIFVGCQEDEDDNDVVLGGSFTVDGTTYDLTKGFIVDEGGEYDIILTSSGISPIPNEGDEFTGSGELVSIIVISSSPDAFVPGDFVYDGSGNKVPGTIEFATALVNANLETALTGEEFQATGGTTTVSMSGGYYTVTFAITAGTSTFEGSFTGTLTELMD